MQLRDQIYERTNKRHAGKKFKPNIHLKGDPRTSLVVQWLRLYTSTAGGTSSVPGWGPKIPLAAWCSQKIN